MEIDNLILFQKEKDASIILKHQLEGQSLLTKRVLAFQVSLSQVAAATSCYDFWSDNKKSDKNLILDKYINSLVLLVSIGIEKNFSDITIKDKELNVEITEQFINLFIDINDFIVCSSKDNYLTILEDFVCLGKSVGLDYPTIKTNYINKLS